MRYLGARRRPQPERELARRVECVLKGRKPLEDTVLVEELGWIPGDRLELRQRPGEALPQSRERCCVPLALPTRDARSHSRILQPKCSSPLHLGPTSQRGSAVAPPVGATASSASQAMPRRYSGFRPWGESDTPCSSS